MAEITKQALQVSNNTSFPNNNAGAITPSDLRAFNVNMIDSLVDEIGYNADSASWNSSISNLNTFTGSQQPSFTALNAFTASQLNINSGVNTFTQSATGRLNNLEAYTASFTTSVGIYDEGVFVNNVNQINFSGNGITASYVSGKAVVSVDFTSLNNSTASQQISIDALNVNSASVNTSITNINSTTASLNTSASLALVTASFNTGTRNLTFTKGDTTQFSVNIPDVSGSAGDFVTTSSFNAYTASTDSSISQLNASSASQQISIDALNTNSASVNVSITNLNSTTSSFATSISNLNIATQSLQSQLATIGGQSGSWITESETGSFATTGSNTFVGTQTINADAYVSGTADLGFVSIRDNGAINLYGIGLTRQSYGIVTNPANGDLVFNTNPGNGRLMTFNETDGIMNLWNGMKLDTSFIGIDVYDHPLNLSSSFGGMTTMLTTKGNVVVSGSMIVSGSAVVTGSLIASGSAVVTGPMVVAGVQNINYTSGSGLGEVYLLADSGSLVIGNQQSTPTYAALAHLSSSALNGNTNLIFKPNNNAVDTIISGSSNIFTNPAAATAGFKRYLTVGNVAIGGSGAAVPQISGSMAWSPTISNNVLAVAANSLTWRGPVSSSASTFNNNVLAGGTVNLGTSPTANFERAVVGTTFNGNVIAGTFNAIASKTPLSASITIGSNVVGGTVSLNMDSSSINFNGNSVQGGLTINNSYFPATTGSQVISAVNGGLYIGAHSIFLSGSNTTFTGSPGRTITNAIVLGTNNVISASLNGDLAQVASTALIGQGLVVVGTNSRTAGPSAADWGSVFVGRWNSDLGTADTTAETIFAVGTGTSTTTRKTGFLIDSGSNTFVEGTLNVSGSTSLTGSLTIQSGSSFFANGTKQFNVGAFYSTVTQSGSAAVSQSMQFNTTDISNGITIVNGSQFTFANAGVYNIQFSAQILADTGADDVWIWLKKNGTNIPDTAGRVTLANNDELMAAWNYVVSVNANDYIELVWQNSNGDAVLLYNTATGNIPAVTSVIATVTQVR